MGLLQTKYDRLMLFLLLVTMLDEEDVAAMLHLELIRL